jgi:hypothetical protein
VSYDHKHHRLLNTPCSPREKINKNLGEQGKGNPGNLEKKPDRRIILIESFLYIVFQFSARLVRYYPYYAENNYRD